MASSPKINHDARYQKLLKEMEASDAQARKREAELLVAAGNLKQAVQGTAGSGADARASEKALDAAYAKVQKLQEQRSQKTAALLKAANDAYAEYDASKVGVTLTNQDSVAKLASSHSQYARFMATVSKAMQKQLAAAAKIHAAIEAQIKGIGSYMVHQLVAAFNSNSNTAVATKAAGKLSGSANDSAFLGENADRNPKLVRTSSGQLGTANKGYDRIKEDSYTRRAVGALERLANRPRGAKGDGGSLFSLPSLTSLLGGLAAAGLGAWMKDMWVPLKAFGFAATDLTKLTRLFTEGGLLEKGAGLAKRLGTALMETLELDKGWAKLTDKIKSLLGLSEEKIMSKLNPLTEGFSKAMNWIGEALRLPQLKALGTSLLQKAGAAVETVKGIASTAGSLLANAGSEFRAGAGVVGDVVAWGGRVAGNAASGLGNMAANAATWVANSAGGAVKSAAGAATAFLGKWANKIGNAGAIISTALGVYEEATGNHINLQGADWKTLVKEAIFDQMSFGRRVGGSFNKWFEDSHGGQSIGSMLFDYMNEDTTPQKAAAIAGRPIDLGKVSLTKTGPAAAPVASRPAASSPSSAGSKSRSTAAGFAPPLTPSAIPDTLGSDIHSSVQNYDLYAGAQ